jgi:hypothetical protein
MQLKGDTLCINEFKALTLKIHVMLMARPRSMDELSGLNPSPSLSSMSFILLCFMSLNGFDETFLT